MENPIEIELYPLGKRIKVEHGAALQDVLHAYGIEFPCGGRGRCGGCRMQVIEGSLPILKVEEESFTPQELAEGWRFACRQQVASELKIKIWQCEANIVSDHTQREFSPREGRGVVVDLGSTTVVAQLLDLTTGQVLAVSKALNPQAIHGSDIVHRVTYALNEDGHVEMMSVIRNQIEELIGELLLNAGTDPQPHTVVIAGNSVMHHLFCGIDVSPISKAPFNLEDGGLKTFSAKQLGWQLNAACEIKVMPCLGGFVGSDILAGILATDMHKNPNYTVLVDLGTNGEIAVGNINEILCASTAAGPAFEAGGVAMGMQARTGAISEVRAKGHNLHCRVIGGGTARGLCGSGLVDAVAVGLDLGLVEPSGRISKGKELKLKAPVVLTQNDIRQLQLAKGAIAAGIQILIGKLGLQVPDIERVYLAGAFGNYVNAESAQRIGLIEFDLDKIEAVGNTSLLGTKIALFEDEHEDCEYRELRKKISHVSLAEEIAFQSRFIEATVFPNN